jgi:hypothetical protein
MEEKGGGHCGKCSISSLDLKRKRETLTSSKRVIDLNVYRTSYGTGSRNFKTASIQNSTGGWKCFGNVKKPRRGKKGCQDPRGYLI